MDKAKLKSALISGVIKNNPTFVLVLGMCPTLAMTAKLSQGFAMGVATAAVLIFSNLMISLLRNVIPDKMRIPCYIVVISTFVIMVEMLMKKFLPDLYSVMKTFISLIVVNCIILARAESYASKNGPLYAAADGLSIGVGFTLSLCLISATREFLATGGLFGKTIPGFPQMEAGAANAFGFLTLACYMALFNAVKEAIKEKKNKRLIAEARAIRHARLKEIAVPENGGTSVKNGNVSAGSSAKPQGKIGAENAVPQAKEENISAGSSAKPQAQKFAVPANNPVNNIALQKASAEGTQSGSSGGNGGEPDDKATRKEANV